jgi:hypothetical protein
MSTVEMETKRVDADERKAPLVGVAEGSDASVGFSGWSCEGVFAAGISSEDGVLSGDGMLSEAGELSGVSILGVVKGAVPSGHSMVLQLLSSNAHPLYQCSIKLGSPEQPLPS